MFSAAWTSANMLDEQMRETFLHAISQLTSGGARYQTWRAGFEDFVAVRVNVTVAECEADCDAPTVRLAVYDGVGDRDGEQSAPQTIEAPLQEPELAKHPSDVPFTQARLLQLSPLSPTLYVFPLGQRQLKLAPQEPAVPSLKMSGSKQGGSTVDCDGVAVARFVREGDEPNENVEVNEAV